MMHRDGFEFVGALIQRVDELDIAVTAEAEYLRHLFLDQIVDDDLGTIEHIARRHRITPRLPRFFLASLFSAPHPACCDKYSGSGPWERQCDIACSSREHFAD